MPPSQLLFNKNGLENELQCDSAGTTGFHAGESADFRMKQVAQKRGYHLTSISRPVDPDRDFDRFDYIIGMDRQNVHDLKSMSRNENDHKRIYLMTDFCLDTTYDSVPDPYYSGTAGFETVLDILEDACAGLISELQVNG